MIAYRAERSKRFKSAPVLLVPVVCLTIVGSSRPAEDMAETVEETYETEFRRKVVRTSLKIEEVSVFFVTLIHHVVFVATEQFLRQ